MKEYIIIGMPPPLKVDLPDTQSLYRLYKEDGLIDGTCKPTLGHMTVSVRKGIEHANETLFHEIFHACEKHLHRLGLLEGESTELYVEYMAYILYHTLLRNKFLKMNVEWDQLHFEQMNITMGGSKYIPTTSDETYEENK